jgi:hypothetical protein
LLMRAVDRLCPMAWSGPERRGAGGMGSARRPAVGVQELGSLNSRAPVVKRGTRCDDGARRHAEDGCSKRVVALLRRSWRTRRVLRVGCVAREVLDAMREDAAVFALRDLR